MIKDIPTNYDKSAESLGLNHIQIVQGGLTPAGGFLEFRTFQEKARNGYGKNKFIPVTADASELVEVVKWLDLENREGRGVFIGVNSRVRESGTKKDVELITTAFVDLDTDKRGVDKSEAIEEIVELSPIEPNLITDSGGGVHVLYFLKPTSDFDGWLALQQRLFEKFKHIGADPAVVKDRSRVLRLTPFRNWKYEKETGGRETSLLRFTERDVKPSLAALSELFEVDQSRRRTSHFRLPAEIPEGGIVEGEGRNQLLFREASALRGRGYSQPELANTLSGLNVERCVPPLPDEEINRIAKSAAKYTPSNGLDVATNENRLFLPWGEMSKREYGEPDYTIYGLLPGSVGMITGVSNLGKSSLARGISISLSTGNEYLGIVSGGQPLKVLYADFETPARKYHQEISIMVDQLSEDESSLVTSNLLTYIAQTSGGEEPLNLSKEADFDRLKDEARLAQADVLIIDTVSAAFAMKNENDNSEVTNKVMKPLQKLATELDCVVLIVHHIGKAGSEEGSQNNTLYRARGASSFVGLSHAVLQLDTKKTTSGGRSVSVEFVKVKDEKPAALALTYDSKTHWFRAELDTQVINRADETRFKLIKLIDREMKRGEIDAKATQELKLSRATVTRLLSEAVSKDELTRLRHGRFAPTTIPFRPEIPTNLN